MKILSGFNYAACDGQYKLASSAAIATYTSASRYVIVGGGHVSCFAPNGNWLSTRTVVPLSTALINGITAHFS